MVGHRQMLGHTISVVLLLVLGLITLLPATASAYSTYQRWPQERNIERNPIEYWIYNDLYTKLKPYSDRQDPNDQPRIEAAIVGPTALLHASSRFRVRIATSYRSTHWNAFNLGGIVAGSVKVAGVRRESDFGLDAQGRILSRTYTVMNTDEDVSWNTNGTQQWGVGIFYADISKTSAHEWFHWLLLLDAPNRT
jgi:hypothetical protein